MKFDIKTLGKFALALATVAVAMSPELAMAGGNFTAGYAAPNQSDLSGQITQMANQSSGVPALIAWGGYIIGTAFIAFGIFKLKAHSDNAAQNKLGPALGLLFTGAAFLVMPFAAGLMIKTSNMNQAAANYSTAGFQ